MIISFWGINMYDNKLIRKQVGMDAVPFSQFRQLLQALLDHLGLEVTTRHYENGRYHTSIAVLGIKKENSSCNQVSGQLDYLEEDHIKDGQPKTNKRTRKTKSGPARTSKRSKRTRKPVRRGT